jgi:hypothetical protein
MPSRPFLAGVLVASVLGASVLVAQAPTTPMESVCRAELAFARTADEQGIRPAFLAWLAEDARVFTPRMTRGWLHYGKEPGDPGHLAWYPEAMGTAALGDLAWSLGPWTYSARKGGAAIVHGHFLSLWRRQPGGDWKVAADIGVPHAAPAAPIRPFMPGEATGVSKAVPSAAEALPALRRKEAALAEAWAAKGGAALLPELAKGARLLRSGAQPIQDEAALRQVLAAEPAGPAWVPAWVEASEGGDLAWTCGELLPPGGRGASFLRVWILEAGAWKVLFDVRVPHAPVVKPAAALPAP